MTLTWYDSQAPIEGRNFGALAVIWPLLERMQLAPILNRHLPADPQAEFDHGTVLSLLVAARLYSPVALVNVARWAADSGADILWDMPLDKINDDRLGRSLDALFGQRHSILASLALHAAREFDVPLREVHYDPTHILLHGAYEASQAREGATAAGGPARGDDQLPPAHITKGRPLSDAPQDVRLVHAGLCTVVDRLGPLPLFGHTVGGNQNGHTAVAEQLALLQKHLRPPELTLFSDRGTFSVGHLARLHADGFHAVAAAPWEEFRALLEEQRPRLTWRRASYLSLEQRRRRATDSDLPREHYDLAVVRHELTDSDSGQALGCRVIFVFSTADQKVARRNREKSVAKLRAGLEKLQRSVAEGHRHTDPTSVARRVAKLFGDRQAAGYFRYEMTPLGQAEQRQAPPPRRGCRRPTHRFSFTYDEAAAERDAREDGYSALVTTAPRTQSADVLFRKYKEQNFAEQVNHVFKAPLAVHPVFLKSPRRVEALVFVLMIALLLYYLLQRLYRQTVPAEAPAQEQRTTTQTILRAFANYTLLLRQTRVGRHVQPTQLTARQREVLHQLGFDTPAQVLSRRLPRGP
jgi:transposase